MDSLKDISINIPTFIADLKKLRLGSKNQWYFFVGKVNGKQVTVKGYHTWLQNFIVDGIRCDNPMDQSVKDMNEHINTVCQNLLKPLTLDMLFHTEITRIKKHIPTLAETIKCNAIGMYSMNERTFDEKYEKQVNNLINELRLIKV